MRKKNIEIGPLSGIRIVDLSRYGPGKYCTMLMADFGAEVINVDVPRVDISLPTLLTDDTSVRYLTFNRSKRSMTINLKKKQGIEVFSKLIKTADILVEGFRPGVARNLRIDYHSLKKINPRLIYCSISGFGQDGPYAGRPGHDPNYVGLSGILSLTGDKNGPPSLLGTQVADLGGGFSQATIGILMAIVERERSGKGQYIDIGILDGLIFWLWFQGMDYLLTGKVLYRGETLATGSYAGLNIYQASDGKYLTLGCYEPWFWERLCRILGREEFIEHQNDNGEKMGEIISTFKEIFKTKGRDQWLHLLEKADILCGAVNNLSEAFSDPQVIHRKMVSEVSHPTLGKIRQIGIPIKLSRTPGKIKSPPPRYGEHTEEILKELEYSLEHIRELRRKKVIE